MCDEARAVAFMANDDDILVSIREQPSHREHQPSGSCDIAMRCATPDSAASNRMARDEARVAATVSEPKVLGANSLSSERRGAISLSCDNRCALKSLDTDRSTTLSPETVTANCVSAAKRLNISAAARNPRRKIFQLASHRRFCRHSSSCSCCIAIEMREGLSVRCYCIDVQYEHSPSQSLFLLPHLRLA
jgi:hypothetical protein